MTNDDCMNPIKEETRKMEKFLEGLNCSERLTAVHVLLRGYIYGYIDQETCEEVLEQSWSTEEWSRIADKVEGNFSNYIFEWVEDAASYLGLFDDGEEDEGDEEEGEEDEDGDDDD